MKKLLLSALLLISTTILPAGAQTAIPNTPAGSGNPLLIYGPVNFSGQLPAYDPAVAGVDPKTGRTHYTYSMGGVGCVSVMDHPAEVYAQAAGGVSVTVGEAYRCWERLGLVQADRTHAEGVMRITDTHHGRDYVQQYLRVCGESVAPLGLPDPRPSRCATAPNPATF